MSIRQFGIDWGNDEDRARAAAIFDAGGYVQVTKGDAVLRVLMPSSARCLPVLGDMALGARRTAHGLLLTRDDAHNFLLYIEPHVCRKRIQVENALHQWKVRKKAKLIYRGIVERSARSVHCR